ncbi:MULTISPECIES: hypothetical protein [unclassified Wolbachia]
MAEKKFWVFIWLKVKFWLGVLNDLKERGVDDILIACVKKLSYSYK